MSEHTIVYSTESPEFSKHENDSYIPEHVLLGSGHSPEALARFENLKFVSQGKWGSLEDSELDFILNEQRIQEDKFRGEVLAAIKRISKDIFCKQKVEELQPIGLIHNLSNKQFIAMQKTLDLTNVELDSWVMGIEYLLCTAASKGDLNRELPPEQSEILDRIKKSVAPEDYKQAA